MIIEIELSGYVNVNAGMKLLFKEFICEVGILRAVDVIRKNKHRKSVKINGLEKQ